MKLLTKELEERFPPLCSTAEKEAEEIPIIVKFFNPCGAGTWFATEYDPNDKVFYGYANLGDDEMAECGLFSLYELESIKLPLNLRIERDLYLQEGLMLSEVIEKKGHI